MRTKNAGSVFEQRNALARQRAHLRNEVRHRAGRACHGLDFASFRSDPVPCDGSVKQQTVQILSLLSKALTRPLLTFGGRLAGQRTHRRRGIALS
ncbi:hypothetical protein F3I27_02245 [Pantoea sp. Bo_2]|nr:hypothetical protein F3I57_10675 [Pantoea sp. VH_3]KAA5953176.1 hypothetical protein F3I56_09770 [Pantoea sp. VH_25]KAA5953814.1 hypothetical protein F3I55_15870 [Pantoea sp. VH_24]KAA5959612.1 hypothetical protein F3I53_13140 [Pantoea sp. VH_16]KAA5963363.1 hypothetical protein F3I54_16020 [Pantoea sp. VH_18]KAA5983263.1 hypothetical protein F3I48_08775 [Pantoea sp. M_3]KAA5996733.1 hypothetical protein F3I46_14100 [Pantoea sp. M_1]KAA6005880.1 hypothetical protein F3I45_04630 [Pantoea s